MQRAIFTHTIIHLNSMFTNKIKGLLAIIGLFDLVLIADAQDVPVNPKLLQGTWNAQWITCPSVPLRAYGVYHFRKTMDLPEKPEHFIIHVSADNRYLLYVNGIAVGRGPARG